MAKDFCREDFSILAVLLKRISGIHILSLNDKPDVRELLENFVL